MLKAKFSALLFALLTSFSLAIAASELPNKPVDATKAVQVANVSTVNINSADAATLQRELSGVGKAKSEAIVAYRDQHGPFASVDELLEVKGIGAAILEKNREKLSVN
jgi:competence protein ComEA